MIEYHYETDFKRIDETKFTDWISRVIISEKSVLGNIGYIFCDDSYLLQINQKYLDHNTYTDIISFDYCEGTTISGDIFISVERVKENAIDLGQTFEMEFKRVMVHGVLHFLGYKDKAPEEAVSMRIKENEMMALFHVEQ